MSDYPMEYDNGQTCDECEGYRRDLVIFWPSNTAISFRLCRDCLKKAVDVANPGCDR